MKNTVLTFLVLILVYSCGSLPKFGKKQATIANTSWALLDGGSMQKTPTLNIEAARISGTGGCNNYFSDIVLNAQNGSFVAGSIGSTRMSCGNMTGEQNYFDLLSQVNRYSLKEDVLELYKDNLLLLKFKQVSK